jgi:hypothetical protein
VNLFKVITYFFLSIFIFILIALIFQFVINAKYTFTEPHAFKGEYLYNPYQGVDSTKWRIANFHAHTRLFPGKTDGDTKSSQFIDSVYRYFGYSIIDISDYQRINTYGNKNEWFVPVYEHGYQYYKNHQLVLNAKNVNWLDFFFRQTLSNKQSIINKLKKDTSVVLTIVHPVLRKAYSYNEFKYLSNYNCLEIVNNNRLFTSYYDTILSAGHPVFLMANDDAHDMRKISEGCHSFNLINTDLVKDSILHSIKTGCSVGVDLNISLYKTNEEKKAGLQKLPEITSVTLKNDTLSVRLNLSVKSIKFIGQKGVERKRITNCATGTYFFSKQDTYIRTEIECHDGTIYFLNPVFRYDGVRLTDNVTSYNVLKTWAWRSAVLAVLLLIFFIWKNKK